MRVFVFVTYFFSFCLYTSCQIEKQQQELIPILIDADTANEVDDLFAIIRAVVEPKLDLVGLTSAQFHISPLASDTTVLESQKMNEELMAVLDAKDIPLPVGSNVAMASKDSYTPSPASDFIVEQAMKMNEGDSLNIVILGSCTNVATAVRQNPAIVDKIKVHYIGFWHDTLTNKYDLKEFNSGNDTVAIDILLNTVELDFNVMTATTCQHLVFDKEELLNKFPANEVQKYLVNRWNDYDRWWTEKDPEKKHWIMWDVAIIEAIIHPQYSKTKLFSTPSDNLQREITIHTSIDVESMKQDFWDSINKYLN